MTYIPEILPRTVPSQREESAPRRNGHGVRAILGAELAHDVLKMDLHRFLGDEEILSDLAVAVPPGDAVENFDFPFAEIVFTQMFGHLGSDFLRNTLNSGMNPPNRFGNALVRFDLTVALRTADFPTSFFIACYRSSFLSFRESIRIRQK